MKYQIILSSDQQMPDDDFKRIIEDLWRNPELILIHYLNNFTLIEARNLEGIREELWKTKEELIEHSNLVNDSNDSEKVIENSFNEISKLFKLDS